MSGHTPKPWGINVRQDGDIEITAGEDDSVLAVVFGDDNEPECWPVSANARLIVAAPEMEEILTELIKGGRYDRGRIACYDYCVDRALGILAKINGGES
jgi:hypothetical protein